MIVDGDLTVNGSLKGTLSFKSCTAVAVSSGINYLFGFYSAPTSDVTLTQASLTQTYRSANEAHASHAFIVAGGAGTVNTGVVGLRVTGTSITDAGVRTTSDSEVLSADITALSTNDYLETTKKWLGVITFELYTVSGSPTTYSIDCNYGICKYEDWGNRDFTITDFEAVGFSDANDSGFELQLLKHANTGWTYSASAFVPGDNAICDIGTDYSTDDNLINGGHFAYKRAGLSETITGSGSEGIIVRFVTTVPNSVEYMNVHIGANL